MSLWNVYALDVWGNEEDGYDVNDRFLIGEFDDNGKEDIVSWLYLKEFTASDNPEDFEVEDYEFNICVSWAEDGMPMFSLERKEVV